jgi:hypothetical protein
LLNAVYLVPVLLMVLVDDDVVHSKYIRKKH